MTAPFVSHVEWGSGDVEALRGFLTSLFGWEFAAFMPGYYFCQPAAGPGLGLMQNPQAQAGGTPNVSVRVASIAATLEQAQALGGAVAVPETPLPGGSFAFVRAPDGNLIGLQQFNS